jgi:hypothetical protein
MIDAPRRNVLTVTEVGAALGVSERVARRRIGEAVLAGTVQLVRIGRNLLIATSDLDRLEGSFGASRRVGMVPPASITLAGDK